MAVMGSWLTPRPMATHERAPLELALVQVHTKPRRYVRAPGRMAIMNRIFVGSDGIAARVARVEFVVGQRNTVEQRLQFRRRVTSIERVIEQVLIGRVIERIRGPPKHFTKRIFVSAHRPFSDPSSCKTASRVMSSRPWSPCWLAVSLPSSIHLRSVFALTFSTLRTCRAV